MQTQLKAYLIAETADLIAAEAEEAVIMRAEAEALDRLAKAVAGLWLVYTSGRAFPPS
jgi:hypothetical protein